ncbi:MAG: chromosomal replication initiator protein DnaA [Syntrophobacterales bacterium]|nr:chromosomal replication initiator protein DnaA [Syntrophobacterales bacterium]
MAQLTCCKGEFFRVEWNNMGSDLWHEIRSRLERTLSRGQFDLWIAPLECLGVEGEVFILGCQNNFHIQWIREKLEKKVLPVIQAVLPQIRQISYQVIGHNKKAEEFQENQVAERTTSPRQLSIGDVYSVRVSPFNPRFTFDDFVTGQCNHLAYASSLAVATGKYYNLQALYIMADSGLGKSHLSQAIGNHVFKNSPQIKVHYVTAEQFTNDMISALKKDRMEAFKEKYRSHCDILLLEKIEFFGGKEKIQSELIYTLDELMDSGKKIICTSSKLPKDIPRLHSELRSRLSGAFITKIDPPDFETRLNILRKKASYERAKIPLKVLEFLAEHIEGDVRRLESSLVGLIAKSNILGIPVTIELARDVVITLQERLPFVDISLIQDLVCETFNLKRDELLSSSRRREIMIARKVALYLCCEYTKETIQSVARAFNRTHSTVLHTLKEVQKSINSHGDPLKKYIDYIAGKLKARCALSQFDP